LRAAKHERNKDVLYDPAAVEACLRVFKEKGFKIEKAIRKRQ
jgi:hypothetical protein